MEKQIQELTSLQQLEISSGPRLMKLPEGGFRGLTSLGMLTIQGCDGLIHEDWHKISPIPRIIFDDKWLQHNE